MMKNKKGDISIGWIVTIIILIIGFGLLLVFYYNIGGTSTIDREVCHQSVIFRATLPEFANAQTLLPLKCKTNKICITTRTIGRECEDFIGETGITYVKVKNEEEIAQLYSEEILSCWSMMGEGKLSLFPNWWVTKFGVGTVHPSCVICSRMAFDKVGLEKSEIDISKADILEYMMTHKIPGKELTYYEYINGQQYSAQISFKDQLTLDKSLIGTEENQVIPLSQEYTVDNTLDKYYGGAVIFMQVFSPKQGESILNIGKGIFGVTATSFLTAPMATIKVIPTVAKAWPLLIIGAVIQQGNVAYNRAITAGYCGDITFGSEARNGCSVVREVNYDAEDIGKYCESVESIP